MLSLAPLPAVAHDHAMRNDDVDDADQKALGLALKALRRRAGMTLAEAGDAMQPPMSGQAWGLYEAGKREGLHHPRTQARLARAVQAEVAELLAERDRLAGTPAANQNHRPIEPARAVDRPARSFSVPVISRVRADPDTQGGLVYDASHAEASVDLGWLFGPTAGRLRMADDRLKGRVEAGQLLHYDRAMPPRDGQIAVIETRAGGLHVYEYRQIAGGKLTAAQSNPPGEIEFPLDLVKGVYAVRMFGD